MQPFWVQDVVKAHHETHDNAPIEGSIIIGVQGDDCVRSHCCWCLGRSLGEYAAHLDDDSPLDLKNERWSQSEHRLRKAESRSYLRQFKSLPGSSGPDWFLLPDLHDISRWKYGRTVPWTGLTVLSRLDK